jgi:hypothetical protein
MVSVPNDAGQCSSVLAALLALAPPAAPVVDILALESPIFMGNASHPASTEATSIGNILNVIFIQNPYFFVHIDRVQFQGNSKLRCRHRVSKRECILENISRETLREIKRRYARRNSLQRHSHMHLKQPQLSASTDGHGARRSGADASWA